MKTALTLLFIPLALSAQFSVVSVQPVNNAVNVPTTVTLSMTFSEALDTVAMNKAHDVWFTNVDSMTAYGYSADLKTTWSTHVLKPNTPYFMAFIWVKALSGAVITVPHVYYFTTGPTFPAATVSGTVSSGSTGVSPEHSIVGLSRVNFMKEETDGSPPFAAWTNVNANGTFTVPYVPNGTYWPLAAKDADGNGEIDPEKGADAMAFSDSIVVNNAPVTGVNLTFFSFRPSLMHETVAAAESLAAFLPPDKVLRMVQTWDADSVGRSSSWNHVYTAKGNSAVYSVRVGQFESRIDSMDDNNWNLQWLMMHKPVTGLAGAVASGTAMVNVENAGGRTFRQSPHPDTLGLNVEMTYSDHTYHDFWGQIPDTNAMYWSVLYILGVDYEPWRIDGKKYLCSGTTGSVLFSGPLAVRNEPKAPDGFVLRPNYPNPFNPATTIEFTVPTDGVVRLTVYDALGREAAVLTDGFVRAGVHTVRFDASSLASGLYVARGSFNGRGSMVKMLLVR